MSLANVEMDIKLKLILTLAEGKLILNNSPKKY